MLFLEKLEQKRLYIIFVILICILVGILYAVVFMPKNFISSSSMMLIKTEENEESKLENNGNIELTSNLISTFEELIKSDTSLEEAKNNLKLQSQINSKSISVKRVSDSDTFQISVKALNSEEAININIKIAEIFESKIKTMYKNTQLYIVDKAHIVSSSKIASIIIFGIIGLLIGVLVDLIYIVILMKFEKNVKNDKDVESNFSLKILGSIPLKNYKKNADIKLVNSEIEKTSTNKAFKQLRSNIQFLNVNNKTKNIILVTSCSEKEGKSYVSSNLAVSYANVGKKVIIVDANLNSGNQAQIFNIPNDMGLSNFLSNLDMAGIEINERVNSFIRETNIKNLNVITSGTMPPNSSELLSSSKLPEMLKDLSVFYDVIIIDGTMVLNKLDSLILSRYANSVAIVTVENKTKKDDLWKVKRDIQNVGGRIVGIILNKVKIKEEKEERNSYKVFENLKEKIKKYISKLKENRKQKLLESASKKIEDDDENKEEQNEKIILENEIIEDEIIHNDIKENSESTDNAVIDSIEENNKAIVIETSEKYENEIIKNDEIINDNAKNENDIIVIDEKDLKEISNNQTINDEEIIIDKVNQNATQENNIVKNNILDKEKIENIKKTLNNIFLKTSKSAKRTLKKLKIRIFKLYKNSRKTIKSESDKLNINEDKENKIIEDNIIENENNTNKDISDNSLKEIEEYKNDINNQNYTSNNVHSNKVKSKMCKKDNDNIVLVVVDAHNEICRAFSKTCYTEKLVRGLDTTDGFVKAHYSSYLLRKRKEALVLMYSLTKKQVNRIDPIVYATLLDYDDCVWIEKKVTSNKAEAYILCMAKEYTRNDGEKIKDYIKRCKESRKRALYECEIEIDYNIDLLWKSSKMKFSDKVAMDKFAHIYGIRTDKNENTEKLENEYVSSYSDEVFFEQEMNRENSETIKDETKNTIFGKIIGRNSINPIRKIEEVTNNIVNVEQVKAKSIQEIAKEVDEELNAKNNINMSSNTFGVNSNFSEVIVDSKDDFNFEAQRQERRKEAEVLKKIQREKNAKKKKEERLRKQKEREERNKQREKIRREKELEREKKIEEARIEEELLVDNLYPKTKNNKNL